MKLSYQDKQEIEQHIAELNEKSNVVNMITQCVMNTRVRGVSSQYGTISTAKMCESLDTFRVEGLYVVVLPATDQNPDCFKDHPSDKDRLVDELCLRSGILGLPDWEAIFSVIGTARAHIINSQVVCLEAEKIKMRIFTQGAIVDNDVR